MNTVMVLGANGRLGQAAVRAFAQAGWQVRAQLRRPSSAALPAGVQRVQAEATDSAALAAAAQGVDVIVHALNPPDYTRWATDLPPLTDAVINLARACGATLMLAGSVYNFGNRLPAVLSEDTPFAATHPKAALRIALEAALAQAARAHGVRSVVIRAGDFLGGTGTWLDLAMAKRLAAGRFVLPGPPDLPHAWAWLPDLAQVFVQVAERRATLAPHAVLHYEGLTLTVGQLQQGLEAALGKPLRRAHFPWAAMRLAALLPGRLGAMPRALLEMRYLWQRPHRLDDARLRALLGTVPATPLDAVLRGCLAALPGAAVPGAPDAAYASAR